MESIKKYVKEHVNEILLAAVTIVLSVAAGVVFYHWPEYIPLGNVGVALFLLWWLWPAVVKGGEYRKGLLFRALCTVALALGVNQLFTAEAWMGIFPFLRQVPPGVLFFLAVVGIVLAVLIWKLVLNYRQKRGAEPSDPGGTTGVAGQPEEGHELQKRKQIAKRAIAVYIVVIVLELVATAICVFKGGQLSELLDEDVLEILANITIVSVLIFLIPRYIGGIILSGLSYIQGKSREFAGTYQSEEERKRLQDADSLLVCIAAAAGICAIGASKMSEKMTLENLQTMLQKGDWLAGVLYIVTIIVAVFITTLIVRNVMERFKAIGTEENRKKIQASTNRIGRKINRIISKIADIILGTFESTLDFVMFVPGFLGYMNEMIGGKENREKEDGEDKQGRGSEQKRDPGIKAMKIAALCFAMVSWHATAQGLKTYVFTSDYAEWQAYAISFAIQAILFVLSLELPSYQKRLKKSGGGGSKRRTLVGVWAFYFVILFCSSLFSFFYITDEVYESTQYEKGTVVLKKQYKETAAETIQYVTEGKKLTLEVIAGNVRELSEQGYVAQERSTQPVNIEALESSAKEAKGLYEEAHRVTAQQLESIKSYNESDDFENQLSGMMDKLYERQGEEQKARKDWEAAKKALQDAKDAEKKSVKAQMQVLLTETVRPNPDSLKIEEALNAIIGGLDSMNSKSKRNASSEPNKDFSQAVLLVRKISTALEQYKQLEEVERGTEAVRAPEETRKTAGIALSNVDDIPIPAGEDMKPDEEKAWADKWKEQVMALQNAVYNLPRFSEAMLKTEDSSKEGGEAGESIINTDVLKRYDEIKDKVDELVDNYMYFTPGTNVIEQSFYRLISEYRLLAVFSFAFSFAMDLFSLLTGILSSKLERKKKKKAKAQVSTSVGSVL